ncbi:MAG: ABC transporter permease, partial [Ruminococcus sp.]|nr:ABC transporter permease [Ruminococcus sp.]
STLLSLGLGGILFITSATYMSSFDKENYARQGDFKEAEFVIGISSGAVSLDENGMSGIQSKNPLNSDFIKQIQTIDGIESVSEVKNFGVKFDFPEHNEYGNDDTILMVSNEKTESIGQYLDEGTSDYDKLMSGNYVLIGGNDIVSEIYGWKFTVGDKLIFHYYDGEKTEKKTVEVIGILNNNFSLDNNLDGWFVLPESVINDWVSYESLNSKLLVSVNPEKETEISGQLESLVSERSQLYMETLQDKKQQYENMANHLFSVISGLAIFIMMFSILSMINMMITNIAVRKQELAMLEAIGMTKKQICKMILSESILLSGLTLFITLTIGTLCGYILSTMLYNNGAFYMQFRFPIVFSMVYIAVLIIVPLIITIIFMHNFS